MVVVGNVIFFVRHHLYKWKSHIRIDVDGKFVGGQFSPKKLRRGRRCFSRSIGGASISCSNSMGKDLYVPSNEKITNARLIYAVAPAMGHNQVFSWLVHFYTLKMSWVLFKLVKRSSQYGFLGLIVSVAIFKHGDYFDGLVLIYIQKKIDILHT